MPERNLEREAYLSKLPPDTARQLGSMLHELDEGQSAQRSAGQAGVTPSVTAPPPVQEWRYTEPTETKQLPQLSSQGSRPKKAVLPAGQKPAPLGMGEQSAEPAQKRLYPKGQQPQVTPVVAQKPLKTSSAAVGSSDRAKLNSPYQPLWESGALNLPEIEDYLPPDQDLPDAGETPPFRPDEVTAEFKSSRPAYDNEYAAAGRADVKKELEELMKYPQADNIFQEMWHNNYFFKNHSLLSEVSKELEDVQDKYNNLYMLCFASDFAANVFAGMASGVSGDGLTSSQAINNIATLTMAYLSSDLPPDVVKNSLSNLFKLQELDEERDRLAQKITNIQKTDARFIISNEFYREKFIKKLEKMIADWQSKPDGAFEGKMANYYYRQAAIDYLNHIISINMTYDQ
ncbi:hypothetical protein [Feifania hominis]|uniref:Uncharacterized protein n=1 Tax=Feifania hominis TaxID=2763660 RepID=A0A926DD53_9FIRM|nr:hypothetical protein [Feifania hominis]MBC8536770.1 hypothetical protein [Feifania hominis]